jgi:Carboxypeptidase regulatory-like domain
MKNIYKYPSRFEQELRHFAFRSESTLQRAAPLAKRGGVRRLKTGLRTYLFAALIFAATVSAQTGGTYQITQSVISNGGGDSNGGNFGVTGTSSQSLAGTNSTNGGFAVRGGFWQAFFAPTAALVAVSGQILSANGGGISKAHITLTNASGETRTATTGSFGYFRFDDVEVGQTCIVSVRHKRFQFINETQIVFVAEEITGIVFNALPE